MCSIIKQINCLSNMQFASRLHLNDAYHEVLYISFTKHHVIACHCHLPDSPHHALIISAASSVWWPPMIWWHASKVGALKMVASPLTITIATLGCCRSWPRNASVLPLPLLAMPIKSCPPLRIGQHCAWHAPSMLYDTSQTGMENIMFHLNNAFAKQYST